MYSFDLNVKRVFLFEVKGVAAEDKKQWAIDMLRNKQKQVDRLPQKDDFDEVDRARIKAFLGPWPRALEASGLKSVPQRRKR